MKGKTYRSNGEYIEAMMKQFKLVDMREQYRDLILEAESSSMDYESFLVRLLSVEEDKLAREDDESLCHVTAEMLISAVQELGELAGV